MRLDTQKTSARGAAVAVEMALVSTLMFLMLFGILEYCRFLFLLHVANNAARDAVRYAAIHTNGGTMPGDPTNVAASDIINLVNTGQIGTRTIGSGMSGMQSNLTGYSVQVFYADPSALAGSPSVAQPLAGTNWNDAPFAGKIAVQITGTYTPVLPSLLMLSNAIPFKVTAMASSEAN